MSSVSVRDFLKARRDRALGTILGHVERTVWKKLTPEERHGLRSTTIEALNAYHDAVLDLMKSESGTIRNEEVYTLLAKMNDQIGELVEANGS